METSPTATADREAWLRARLPELVVLVRQRPLLTMAIAGAVGAALGGLVFSRLGRLVFLATAGYVANELWHREGRLDTGKLIESLTNRE